MIKSEQNKISSVDKMLIATMLPYSRRRSDAAKASFPPSERIGERQARLDDFISR